MDISFKERIERFFSHPAIFWIAALLSLLIALPSLSSGFFLDDYCHRFILLAKQNVSLFDWFRVGTPRTDAMLQSGMLPWWTYPESKLVFFRPIAEWLIRLDYWLWPDNVALMHLHSIFWYVALVLAAGCAYRRLMPSSLMLGLALVMFALDAGHSVPVTWLANRNSLVAMTGSMLALWCYTQDRWFWWGCACIMFAVTFGCAEAALGISGYFFAYEVFLAKRSWPVRVLRLLPCALIAILWLDFWRRNGYGSAGQSIYTDPATDPVGFLHEALYRGPFLLFGQFSRLPVELLSAFDDTQVRPYVLVGVLIICGLLTRVFWRVLKSFPLAGFYCLGMLIAIIPICGVQLSGRSLIYVSFGAIGILAMYFDVMLRQFPKKRLAKLLPATLLILHFVISPVLFVLIARTIPKLDNSVDIETLGLGNKSKTQRNLLALSVGWYETSFFFPLFKQNALALGDHPTREPHNIARIRALSMGSETYELSREDNDTLIAHSDDGFEKMGKGIYGFDKGTVVNLDDVSITVLEVDAERVAKTIEYCFKPGALDTYEVFAWDSQRFVSAHLPVVGQVMHVRMHGSS